MLNFKSISAFQLAAAKISSTTTHADVDLAGMASVAKRQVMATATIFPKASTDPATDETCDVKIQEADSTASTDFADITGATFTQVADESTAASETIYFPVSKRYVRAVSTLAGTTPAFTVGVTLFVENRQA